MARTYRHKNKHKDKKKKQQINLGRRRFLQGSLILAGATALGFPYIFSRTSQPDLGELLLSERLRYKTFLEQKYDPNSIRQTFVPLGPELPINETSLAVRGIDKSIQDFLEKEKIRRNLDRHTTFQAEGTGQLFAVPDRAEIKEPHLSYCKRAEEFLQESLQD